jgi:16S rRNA (uracil1498-N3)-methyltransferase
VPFVVEAFVNILMTRRRWIADEFSGNHAALVGAHADHLSRVLRARMGEEFDITTSAGVRRGRIIHIDKGRVEFELGEEISTTTTPNVTLALSIFKFDRMEWAIEKCTELGVERIVPLISHRTEAHLATAAPKRVERWQRIARQASEQSRRVSPPEICQPLKLKEAVGLSGSMRVLLAESERKVMLREILHSVAPGGDVVLAVGPEGGWTEAELELFGEAGWVPASLGDAILRAETAVIAAVAVLMSELQ